MSFSVFERMARGKLKQMPSNTVLAMDRDFTVFGQWYYYPKVEGNYDTAKVIPDYAAGQIARAKPAQTVLVDIEEWDATTEQELLIANCKAALEVTRAMTGAQVGLYMVLPCADYWTPVLYGRYQQSNVRHWMLCRDAMIGQQYRNKVIATELSPLVDYVCPQCYVQYEDKIDEWKWAAAWAVYSARQVGKSVRPIVWDKSQGTGKQLDKSQFVEMVQFIACLPGVDALMLYQHGHSAYDVTQLAEHALDHAPSAIE